MMTKLNAILLFFGLNLLIVSALFAQQKPIATTSEQRMRMDVTVLASDSLQGREAGTIGEQMAADYISKQMEQIGLLPKGNSEGSYLSEFRMSYPVIFKEASLKINDITFEHIEEFGATDLSAAGSITAPAVNIGKGGPGNTFSGFHASDIKGKIVILDISNGWKNEENATILSGIIEKVKAVVDMGAVGVILHNTSRKATEDVLFGSPFTESLTVPVVYIARLPFNKIRKIKTASCTLSVEIDRTVSKPINVLGWIDNKSSKTVVIGAHYDHVGITKARGSGEQNAIHNGADDNASGTAVMLELARWAMNNESLRYNYIFAAFSAEEKGLFGSKAFCTREWVTNDNIVYMLNLDMVGRLGCQGDTVSVLGVASSPVWESLLAGIEFSDFSIRKINGAPPFSDHAPFLKKDIPVIYFTTGIHPDYHTPADDTELINFKGMAEVVAYIRLFMRSAEKLPEIPFHKIGTLQHTRAYIQTF